MVEMSYLLKRAYDLWSEKKGDTVDRFQPVFQYIVHDLKKEFQALIESQNYMGFIVKTSVGKGNWSKTPWITISQPEISPTPQTGVYIALFISLENKGIFLTLTQGTEHFTKNEIIERTNIFTKDIRKPKGFVRGLENRIINNTARGIKWSLGTIYSTFYPIEHIKNIDNRIVSDLNRLLKVYLNYIEDKSLTIYELDNINLNIQGFQNELENSMQIYDTLMNNIKGYEINTHALRNDIDFLYKEYNNAKYESKNILEVFSTDFNHELNKYFESGKDESLSKLYQIIQKNDEKILNILNRVQKTKDNITSNEIELSNSSESIKIYNERVEIAEQEIKKLTNELNELQKIKSTLEFSSDKEDEDIIKPIIDECADVPEYDVFLAYRRRSGQDMADNLKAVLEGEEIKTFIDVVDIPQTISQFSNPWNKYRDCALKKSKLFVLLMTIGFDKSKEVKNEIKLAIDELKDIVLFREKNIPYEITIEIEGKTIQMSDYQMINVNNEYHLVREAVPIVKNILT